MKEISNTKSSIKSHWSINKSLPLYGYRIGWSFQLLESFIVSIQLHLLEGFELWIWKLVRKYEPIPWLLQLVSQRSKRYTEFELWAHYFFSLIPYSHLPSDFRFCRGHSSRRINLPSQSLRLRLGTWKEKTSTESHNRGKLYSTNRNWYWSSERTSTRARISSSHSSFRTRSEF